MTRIFEGLLPVYHGQAYIEPCVEPSDDEVVHLEDAFRGQINGMCGAASPGRLFLMTGLHTGHVSFTLDILDAPPRDDSWEEIVEVSFTAAPGRIILREVCAIEEICSIPLLQETYRVRYCARNVELGRVANTFVSTEPVDSYALIFWLADVAPDAIVKQTSQSAALQHRWAQSLKLRG